MTRRAVSPSDKLRICDGVTARDFDGEWIILDLSGGNYFGLNEIGGLIWQQLVAGRSISEIAAALAPDYDAEEPALLGDVVALANELLERGLMKFQEP